MIVVRPETDRDRLAIRSVVTAAFGSDAEADLVDALRADGDLLVSLVAADGRDIVGHVGFSRLWIEDGKARFAAVALAPMAVSPNRQKQGIGTHLIHEGHRHLKQLGEQFSVVVGWPAYYHRFGYHRDRATDFESPWQGDAMMACAFGAAPRRGTLCYAAAFKRLA